MLMIDLERTTATSKKHVLQHIIRHDDNSEWKVPAEKVDACLPASYRPIKIAITETKKEKLCRFSFRITNFGYRHKAPSIEQNINDGQSTAENINDDEQIALYQANALTHPIPTHGFKNSVKGLARVDLLVDWHDTLLHRTLSKVGRA